MSLPIQNVSPVSLTTAWKNELQRCDAENVLQRFWNKDSSLWPAEEHQIPLVKSNLQWLDLPGQIEPCVNRLIECAKMAEQEGLDHFVFVSMGASNLAAATILDLPNGNAGKRTYLLDTTDPAALNKLETELPIERTLFVFSNKSGKRIETHALLLYFLEKLKLAGIKSAGKHFVALTEEGSYLQLALALTEFEALEQAGKRTIRRHLSHLQENSLKQLADVVIQAVAQIRRFTQEIQA